MVFRLEALVDAGLSLLEPALDVLVGPCGGLEPGPGSAVLGRVSPAVAHVALDLVELRSVGQEDPDGSFAHLVPLHDGPGSKLPVELLHQRPGPEVPEGALPEPVLLQLVHPDVGVLVRQPVDLLRGDLSHLIDVLEGCLVLLVLVANPGHFLGEVWEPGGNRYLVAGEGVVLLDFVGEGVNS